MSLKKKKSPHLAISWRLIHLQDKRLLGSVAAVAVVAAVATMAAVAVAASLSLVGLLPAVAPALLSGAGLPCPRRKRLDTRPPLPPGRCLSCPRPPFVPGHQGHCAPGSVPATERRRWSGHSGGRWGPMLTPKIECTPPLTSTQPHLGSAVVWSGSRTPSHPVPHSPGLSARAPGHLSPPTRHAVGGGEMRPRWLAGPVPRWQWTPLHAKMDVRA